MRDFKKNKQIRHCNIIPSNLLKWVFLDQMKMVFGETKTISRWKRCSRCNGTAPTSQKSIEYPELETLSKFRQHRFKILIKTGSSSS